MTEMGKAHSQEYNVPIVVGSLIAGVFFGGVGGGVAFPTLPTLGTILGITPFAVGIILSTNRFTRLVMSTPAGQLIDKYGARKPIIIGLVIQASAPFGYIAGLHSYYVPGVGPTEIFIAARALWGIGSAFVFIGAYSILIHITLVDNRGKWIGYFRGGQAVGFPSGLIAGGVLTDLYGYEVAFGVAGATEFVAVLIAFFVLPTIREAAHHPARIREIPGLVRSDMRIFIIGSVNFTIRFLFSGILLSTLVIYAEMYDIGIGAFTALGASGFIMAVAVLSSSFTTLVAGTVSDKVRNRALVPIIPLVLFAFGFGFLGLIPTLEGVLPGVILIGIGLGGTNPPLLAYLGDISPDADIGKIGGIYNVFGDLGSAVGPLIAVPLGAEIGYNIEYLLCAGMVLLLIIPLVMTLIVDVHKST